MARLAWVGSFVGLMAGAASARAQLPPGPLDGLSLVWDWDAGVDAVCLEPGFGTIDANPGGWVTFTHAQLNDFPGPPLANGEVLHANTRYSCYALFGDAGVTNPFFTPNNVVFLCSGNVPPNPDGTPSLPLDGTTSALFLGSLLSSQSVASVLPWYRNGEQELLEPPVEAPVAVPGATPYQSGVGDEWIPAPEPLDPGVSTSFVTFTQGLAYPAVQPLAAMPAIGNRPTRVVVDLQLYNSDVNQHQVCILDPGNATVVQIDAGLVLKACTGEGMVDARNSISTYRFNLDPSAAYDGGLLVEVDNKVLDGGKLVVGAVLRGYIEAKK